MAWGLGGLSVVGGGGWILPRTLQALPQLGLPGPPDLLYTGPPALLLLFTRRRGPAVRHPAELKTTKPRSILDLGNEVESRASQVQKSDHESQAVETYHEVGRIDDGHTVVDAHETSSLSQLGQAHVVEQDASNMVINIGIDSNCVEHEENEESKGTATARNLGIPGTVEMTDKEEGAGMEAIHSKDGEMVVKATGEDVRHADGASGRSGSSSGYKDTHVDDEGSASEPSDAHHGPQAVTGAKEWLKAHLPAQDDALSKTYERHSTSTQI
ncbi:hypothetical protein H0H92_005687 [Tricholoma furcatifolium]|nr:hypothetical protein H0H92_005687 [Tricholoma furcatifolium]